MIQFDSVEIFRDKHKGKLGFILGAGYSLAEHDSTIFKNGISFCCNSSIASVDECDYFILTDGSIPYYNFYDKATKVSKNIIYAGRGIDYKYYEQNINGYGDLIEFSANKYLIDRRYDKFGRPFISNDSIGAASFDFKDNCLIDGSDVCHVATHLAYICGCNPIVLVGVDLNYKGEDRYHKKLEGLLVQRNNSPYRYMDDIRYFGRNNQNTDPHLLNSLKSWHKIKNENKNINILNTNSNGLLVGLFNTINLESYIKTL